MSRDHDLSVALDRYAVCTILCAEVRRNLAIAVKGGVQATVGVVTRQCEVYVAVIRAGSSDHNLSVALDRDAGCSIIEVSYSCRDLAIAVKGSIEAAVGIVTRQCEVPTDVTAVPATTILPSLWMAMLYSGIDQFICPICNQRASDDSIRLPKVPKDISS
jgi:hypothetical protein